MTCENLAAKGKALDRGYWDRTEAGAAELVGHVRELRDGGEHRAEVAEGDGDSWALGWLERFLAREAGIGFPRSHDVANQFHGSVEIFHQSCAAFHPITSVIIVNCADFPDGCAMNMAAHCAICRICTRIADGCFFEFANEVEHILHAAFDIGAERPITKTDQAPCQIDGAVASQKQSVANITDVPKPAEVLHHRVKFVSMKHQDASAVGRQVDRVLLDRDASIIAQVAAHMLIVVTGDVNYFGAFSALAKELLDDIVVFLRPENALLQRENIDQISHYIQRLEVILPEKIKQRFRLAVFVAEVNIRNPNCSPVRNAICWHWHLQWFTIQ